MGYFDYDDDDDYSYSRSRGIDDEIWSDTFLMLAPKTLLWKFLNCEDLTNDKIRFTVDDLDNARRRFCSCGYPLVRTTFDKNKLYDWMDNLYPFVSRDPQNYFGWVADLNKLADVNTLSDGEIVHFKYSEQLNRDFLIFVSLDINYYKFFMYDKLIGAFPKWIDFGKFNKNPDVSHEEIKERIKTWKHIPDRYKD